MLVTSKLCSVRAYTRYALGYPSLISGSGDGIRKAYVVLKEQFFGKKIDHMLFMWTTGYCDFFLGGFLSCGLPVSSTMSGLTFSMHLVYPS